ncbi:MAG: phosphate ABC transporter permease subunit PstC [bacterium JZ-2024 1]
MERPAISLRRRRFRGDRILYFSSFLLASLIPLLLLSMFVFLVYHSRLTLQRFGWKFFLGTTWDPIFDEFGALPFIYGSVVSVIIALVLAIPFSLGLAIFIVELTPGWFKTPVILLTELLSAIPSVVYGLWGIFVLVPMVRSHIGPFLQKTLGFLPIFRGFPLGVGLFTAGVLLSIMILPTISSVTREVLSAVPVEQKEAALALGATHWEAIRIGVLPYARWGIFGAVILGLGRALGEAMAVTMVIGNTPQIKASLFEPAYSLTAVLANEFTEAAKDLHLSALIEVALLLFSISFLTNILAQLLITFVIQKQERLKG